MTIFASAGAKLFIGTTLAAATASEFAADTFVEVKELESIGDFGDTAADVPFTGLNDQRTRHLKGSFDAGTPQVVCGRDDADPGQDAMVAAFLTKFDYNFKIIWPTRSAPNTTDGVTYFRAKVMTKTFVNGTGPNNVLRRQFTLGINSELVDIDPT